MTLNKTPMTPEPEESPEGRLLREIVKEGGQPAGGDRQEATCPTCAALVSKCAFCGTDLAPREYQAQVKALRVTLGEVVEDNYHLRVAHARHEGKVKELESRVAMALTIMGRLVMLNTVQDPGLVKLKGMQASARAYIEMHEGKPNKEESDE